jgi:DNA-binding MarR family transcriptional regulator
MAGAPKPKPPGREGMQFSLLYFLFTAERAAETLVDSTLEPDVADGYAAMSLIRMNGPQTPSAIAQQLGMLLTTTSALIERMARRGHVARVPNPDDGRSYLVDLTDEGVARHRETMPVFTKLMVEVLEELEHTPAEVAEALQDLERAVRRVHDRRRGAAG